MRKTHFSDKGKQHRNSSAHVALIVKMYLADKTADEELPLKSFIMRLKNRAGDHAVYFS